MVQSLRRLKESPSQTAGPYIHIGATPNFSGIEGIYPHDLGSRPLPAEVKGERIVVTGRIFDGSERSLLVPIGLPLRFNGVMIVGLTHG